MKKKLLSAVTAAAVLLTAGCSGSAPAQTTTAATTAAETTVTTTAQETTASEATTTTTAETEAAVTEDTGSGETETADRAFTNLSLSVNDADGTMNISRAAGKNKPMGDKDTWTIFVYMCGTDLESSGQGSATSDIVQMLDAQASSNVKFVVQTGGTSVWYNEMFSTNACERYVVQNNDINLVDSVKLANMGSSSTLSDFLNWGVKEYPAEKMGVVFWDHGGGSISGVCFDELNDFDSLTLSEINTALSKVYPNMTDKFEFIGFDCCLMATAETANILATYARFFYGSQESEPGAGWDYTTYGTYLAGNPSAGGAELGKVVADSFYDECAVYGQEDQCTFTIVDLGKFDDLITAFNDYARTLYKAADENLSGIVRGVTSADNFGGNNKAEGYTNMVDIGGIVNNCSKYADGKNVLSALDKCIVYNRNGSDHKHASGLSVYYPLQLQGSYELSILSGICISPYYLSLVDMIAKGDSDDSYTNDAFFNEEGDWTTTDCEYDYFDDSYFEDYTEAGGESSLITFLLEPSVSEGVAYGFALDESGLANTANVRACLSLIADDGTVYELGEVFDVICDWENGIFADNFDGLWLALPDGQLLPTYVAETTDTYFVYTSPIYLNGKRTNLRIKYSPDGVKIEGAWDGIGEHGNSSRKITSLSSGDKIVPVYYRDDDSEYRSTETYQWKDGDNVVYAKLPAGKYSYCFKITDIYGDYYYSDPITYIVR
ncbi:MAG: hypothetical protein IK093_17570 [Ruminiclostridium sp.]|nr:hypothetical protein [Ruminiclostridium sp.]